MLRTFVEVRPGERRAVWSAFGSLLVIMAGHTLLETARDALFLARLPPSRLAWVYMGVAALAVGTTLVQGRRGASRWSRYDLSVLLGIAAMVNVGFWFAVARPAAWVLYALYLWSGWFATIAIARFWSGLGELLTVGQAKRLFALIGAGSVSGAVVGAALARVLAGEMAPANLLLASSVLFVLAACGPVRSLGVAAATPGASAARSTPMPSAVKLVWERPYLRRVAGLVAVAAVTTTWVDFVFKSSVAQSLPPERLGTFFATSALVFNLAALAVQLGAAGWIVRTQGVDRGLALLPLLLVGGSAGVVAGGGLAAAFLLKAIDGAFRHSLHRTALEVLFVPVGAELRARAKETIEALAQRGGQAVASLGIFATAATGHASVILGAAILVLSCLWVRAALRLRALYFDLFREALREVAVQTRVDYPQLDLASLETLIASLNSSRDTEVRAALELLSEQGRERLIPALILYHPSAEVVVHALEIFMRAGRDDFLPITDRLLEHLEPEVRAATLRARAWFAPNAELFERHAADASPIVRATALVGMISYGSQAAPQAERELESLATAGTGAEREAVARAIQASPGAAYEAVLLRLVATPDRSVRLAGVRAMRAIRSAAFVPVLVEMLGDQTLRSEVRAALTDIGPDALATLEAVLADEQHDRRIRRQVPRAVSQFPPQPAAAILLRTLPTARDSSVRYRVLRALERLRALHPKLELDAAVLDPVLEMTLQSTFVVLGWRASLQDATRLTPAHATPVQEMIAALLEQKQNQGIERAFRLLGLLQPHEDVRRVWRGLHSPSPKLRASSLELLAGILRPPRRDAFVALVDDLPVMEKRARAGPYMVRAPAEYAALLRELLGRGGVAMRCLVAQHVAERRILELRDALEALPPEPTGLVARAVAQALEQLGSPTTGGSR